MYSVFQLSYVKDCVRFKEFLKIPKEVLNDLKCCVQRIRKGFCYRDLWNIDSWFLCVIPDMLEEFANTTRSIPGRFLKGDGSETEEESRKIFARWKGILTEMAFLFREANRETCQRKNPYDKEYGAVICKFRNCFGFNGKWVKKKDGTRVFIRELSDIPKYKALEENYYKSERELSEYRANCQKKAFAMFVEYFDCLWD